MADPQRPIVIWDVDGTLTRGGTLLPFLRRVLGTAGLAQTAVATARFAILASLHGRSAAKAELLRRAFAGRELTAIDRAARRFANEIVVHRLRRDAVRRWRWHRARGHQLVLASASPGIYLRHLGAAMGASAVIGTELEVVDGVLTGRLATANCRGAEKARRIRSYLAGWPERAVWMYTDGFTDRPSRALANKPIRVWPHRWRRLAALAVILLLTVPAVSYLRALTYPGSATWQMRTTDWARDHGGGRVVNAIENWYYTRHKPSTGQPDRALLPHVPTGPSTAQAAANAAPSPLPLLHRVARVPGEATWVPRGLATDGRPALYSGFFRPDQAHPSVVAGVAWMRAGTTIGHLVAGTREPGGTGWPGTAQVPPSDVPHLVATFNSGFKMRDISGGYYQGGRTAGRLVNGQASLTIDDRGALAVGQWGRDMSMNRHLVAVRQNLALVVDHGRPAAGLSANARGRWGSPRNQYQYTWRSGAGVDAAGNLIYVAGNSMNLTTLATAMVDAGVVRGMQLDIHTGMASFAWWLPAAGGRSSNPTKLLPAMPRPADRYLAPDQRDFVYLTLR